MRKFGYCFKCNRALKLRKRRHTHQCGKCGSRDILIVPLERIFKAIEERYRADFEKRLETLFVEILEEIGKVKGLSQAQKRMIMDHLSFTFSRG